MKQEMRRMMLETFGTNCIKSKEKGLTPNQICELNVKTATTFFGLDEENAFKAVDVWKTECVKKGIFK